MTENITVTFIGGSADLSRRSIPKDRAVWNVPKLSSAYVDRYTDFPSRCPSPDREVCEVERYVVMKLSRGVYVAVLESNLR